MDIENFFSLYGDQELIKQRREEDKEARKAQSENQKEDGFTPKAAVPKIFKRGSVGKRNEENNYQQDISIEKSLNIPGINDDSNLYFQDQIPGDYEISLAEQDETNDSTSIRKELPHMPIKDQDQVFSNTNSLNIPSARSSMKKSSSKPTTPTGRKTIKKF